MNNSNKLLSDIVAFRTYAKFLPHLGRREALEETINRNMAMHLDRFPKLSKEILKAYSNVHNLYVMPSMRGMQFAGDAVLKNNIRLYNCSFANMDDIRTFGEAVFILLSGAGFGFSVQQRHVQNLPKIIVPREEGTFVVQDSIMGWAQAVDMLIEAYMLGRVRPNFDFSHIRPKGSYLVTTGAKAPGPEPLKKALELVEARLKLSIGRKLKSIEVYDLICILSDAVYAGGIRRAALICLFDKTDNEMLQAKKGDWWVKSPWRARSNNSASMLRSETTKEEFLHVYKACKDSGSGEPGFIWTNNLDYGTNPCKPLYSLILSKDGYITFEQALKKDNLIIMGIDGKWKEASKPFKTGVKQQIYKILLSNGTSLYGTGNHLHMDADGNWRRLDQFSVKDRVRYANPVIHDINVSEENQDNYNDGILAGWVHADGWFHPRSDNPGSTVGLCLGVNEFDMANFFSKVFAINFKPHGQKPDTCKVFSSHKKELAKRLEGFGMTYDKSNLTWVYGKPQDFKLGFIKAVFTADGSVRGENAVELYSTRKSALEVISNVLREFGVYNSISTHGAAKSYIAKDGKVRNNATCYKLRVHAGQFKQIGFLSKFKSDLLSKQEVKEPYRYIDFQTIKEITPNFDIQDVYDITVYDDTHAFYDTGVVTHNCAEISLNSLQFCNLTTINQTGITTEKHLMDRVHAATLLGTLQATYTDFPYLRPGWKETTEREALLGVSFTGVADNLGFMTTDMLEKAARYAVEVNAKYAQKLGISPAARVTTLKPEGTSSCVLGSSSGIHARHSPYYIRRIRMNKDDALAVYLRSVVPDLVEDDKMGSGVVVSIPQESPKGALVREEETALSAFFRALLYNQSWITPGHVYGDNMHNVSVTISVKDDEWMDLGAELWRYRDSYCGVSLLPYDGGTYIQAPFEECDEQTFRKMESLVHEVDLKQVREVEDNTNRVEQIACAGGACELNL